MKNNYPRLDGKNQILLELINPNKSDKILVIGTGAYPKIEFFLYSNYGCTKIISSDIDEKNLLNAQKLLPKVSFVKLDAQQQFPLNSNFFDKIIFTEVLEHLKNEDIALREIKRVLKKKGSLILTVPKKRWFNIFSPITWLQHEREYDENQIASLLKKYNFHIKKLFSCGNIYELFNLWLHLILKHIFKIFHPDIFFQEKIDRTCKKDFKGEGTDIIIKAMKL